MARSYRSAAGPAGRTAAWAATAGTVFLFLAVSTPLRADFIRISSPDGIYLNGTSQIPILEPDFANVGSISDGIVAVSLSVTANARTAPATVAPLGGWATWSAAPFSQRQPSEAIRVLFYRGPVQTLTFTTPPDMPVRTFGVEIEPEVFRDVLVTVTFFDALGPLGSITEVVNGDSGARLFAAGTLDSAFTQVQITMPPDALGAAFGAVRYSLIAGGGLVPEPGSVVLLGIGVLGLIWWRGRRRL